MTIYNPLDKAVVFACDFKQYSIAGKTYIKNYGRAGGAPEYMQCGDGTTSTTFPTPLAGFGASFDGGDYINTGVVNRYERTDPFSLYFYGRSSSSAWNNYIDWASGGVGVSFRTIGGPEVLIFNGPGTYTTPRTLVNTNNSICMVYDGTRVTSSVKFFLGGKLATVVEGGTTISTTIKSGYPIGLGARISGVVSPLNGTAYAFGVFDGILTPRDIVIIDNMVKSNIRS